MGASRAYPGLRLQGPTSSPLSAGVRPVLSHGAKGEARAGRGMRGPALHAIGGRRVARMRLARDRPQMEPTRERERDRKCTSLILLSALRVHRTNCTAPRARINPAGHTRERKRTTERQGTIKRQANPHSLREGRGSPWSGGRGRWRRHGQDEIGRLRSHPLTNTAQNRRVRGPEGPRETVFQHICRVTGIG